MAVPSSRPILRWSCGWLLLSLMAPLHAQTPAPTSDWEGFAGLSLLWADYRPAFPVAGEPASRTTAGFTVYGGGRWRRTWGFELDETFYGDFKVNAGGVPSDRDLCTTSLTGMAWLPLGVSASAYARAGVAYWTATTDGGYAFLVDTNGTKVSGLTGHLGLGIEVAMGRAWILRLEGNLLPRVLDHRLVRVNAGAAWRF
ncbi:outer membrane beta-barrel protein [Geothrix oryzisoli]|uniref:outer membrane beta-barrel protein n=1 Tax=Geothrix oryzisoli TaxID=2922721 RepID=UPI001FACF883|nr:outer membrane beta-barrel protein [Geothrix oryzisoli]